MSRSWSMFALLLAATLAGCASEPPEEIPEPPAPGPVVASFTISDTGVSGAEPSVGTTSTGCSFFSAFQRVMRSCDLGGTWEDVADYNVCQPGTSDPYLWVDPATDRIFNVQMVGLATTWICWSDDDGETWLGNPFDSGPVPINDHIKVGSGPWTAEGYGAAGAATSNVYESAVYFCYNKLLGVFCYTSVDGGATFMGGSGGTGLVGREGGLHGAITAGPDGTVYVPPRTATPLVYVSHDNGLEWGVHSMGEDVGTPDPRKNSEVGTDANGTAYHVWIGEDQGVYMARSFDRGDTWEQTSHRISDASIISATFPHIDAGDAGRVAVAYLGSEDAHLLGTPDIDDDEWDGNAHYAPDNVTHYLWLSYSLDADSPEPTWTHVRLTDDPVQVGSICLNSGDCRDIGGSNRNLLDFNDLTIGPDGRIYIAYADGCTMNIDSKPCADDPEEWDAKNSRDRRGMLAIQTEGPWLVTAANPGTT